jgi:hypothetical protein
LFRARHFECFARPSLRVLERRTAYFAVKSS